MSRARRPSLTAAVMSPVALTVCGLCAVADIVTEAPLAIAARKEPTLAVGPIVHVIDAFPFAFVRLVGVLTDPPPTWTVHATTAFAIELPF